ncbi:MAG: S8 family serine peptidase [Hyphomicrobium sp.]
MLTADVYVGAAEAGDRNSREQQNKERERSNEDARRNAEREQERAREREREAAKNAAESQRESAKSVTAKSEPTRDADKDTGSATARDDRQDRSSDGDDGKKRADGTAAQSTGKSRVEARKIEDDELPRTVEEMFRRWTKSVSSKPEKPDDNSSERKDAARRQDGDGQTADSKTTDSKNVESKSAESKNTARNVAAGSGKSARPGAGAGQLPANHAADFKRVEVLALSSNRQAVARAKALGFTAGPASRFDRLDLSVTKLVAPDGMSASDAQSLLASAAIGDFAFNRRYRIYRAATGGQADGPIDKANPVERTRPPVAMPTPCGTDRCYGAAILGWKPEHSTCAVTARIGVIDTAVDTTHHAFKHRRMDVKSFGRATTAKSAEWHGTGVLALLAGDPASDTPGLVHDAHFLVANAFYTDDDGMPSTDTMSLLSALDWLDRQKADIVNMSLAGPPDDLLRAALDRLAGRGMIFVAAAGNEGPTAPPSYPAAYPSVIAVTAVGRDLRSYRYANRGEHIDIAAPGVQIWTALPGAKSAYHSGTSFAAPFATATIAATLPPPGQRSKGAVLQRLAFKDLGEPGRDPIYGNGLLQGPNNCSGPTMTSSVTAPGAPTSGWKPSVQSAPSIRPAASGSSEKLSWR